MAKNPVKLTRQEWVAAGTKRYGKDSRLWKFICPSCGYVQGFQDFLDAGMPATAISVILGFSCVGRAIKDKPVQEIFGKPGPCNYAGGGLFSLNPIHVDFENQIVEVFDFADQPLTEEQPSEQVSDQAADGAHQHAVDGVRPDSTGAAG